MPLILELSSLLSVFDDMLCTVLKSEKVELPNDKCAELISKLSWRFKLSTVAERRLFFVARGSGANPSVCQDTLSLVKLHYAWFKKHTIPFFFELAEGISDL